MFEWLSALFGRRNRPLTREEIDSLPDRKLYFRALYNLPDADAANDSQWTFVYALELDGEVRNGGFNQYFYNAGEHRLKAGEAFETMGAGDLAGVAKRANACFDANRERLETLWDGTMKGFSKSYKEDFFGGLDREYFALVSKERFYALMADFVRRRADDFLPES